VATFRIEFQDRRRQETYRIRPGQFNMLYLPGVGEVPISVSVTPDEGPGIGHTIRFVGRVTHAIAVLRPGALIGLRGPYGRGWPLEQLTGREVLLVAGGLGLAPLRPLVLALLAERIRYGRLILLYGARQPADLLYQREYPDWQRRGMEVLVTVDRADPSWRGRVGVVPILLQKLHLDPERTVMLTCGPEIMMRFSIAEARTDRIGEQDIHLALERNMHCAVGLCGHCQLGPDFVCKDGPVFAYPEIARFLHQKNF
jgi:NAD(P)H-flavin reductase